MCRILTSLFVLHLLAGTAHAQPASPLAGDAFERLSAGRTLHFSLDGEPFGSEQFFAGRRSLWRFADGECSAGRWHDKDGLICFSYDNDPEPQCWRISESRGRVAAELFEGGVATGLSLDLSDVDDTRLECPGPDLGT